MPDVFVQLAVDLSVFSKDAPATLQLEKLVRVKFAPLKRALERFDPLKSVSVKSQSVKIAIDRLQVENFALTSDAPRKSTDWSCTALRKVAPVNVAPRKMQRDVSQLKVQLERSQPEKSHIFKRQVNSEN